jgi:hypothetical protein
MVIKMLNVQFPELPIVVSGALDNQVIALMVKPEKNYTNSQKDTTIGQMQKLKKLTEISPPY